MTRPHIITFTSFKGGVGKTTTAMEFTEILNRHGRKSLAIDLDGQRSLSLVCGALWEGEPQADKTVAAVFDGDQPKKFKDVITPTKYYGDIVCGHQVMFNANASLTAEQAIESLKQAMEGLDNYEFVIFDTPPALSVLTLATMCLADYVIIPVHADVYSLQSIHHTYDALRRIKAAQNPTVKCSGVLFTEITNRLLISRNMIGTMIEHCDILHIPVFNARIRRCCYVMECAAALMTLHELAPTCTSALDYEDAVREFLEREGLGSYDNEEI